MKSYFYLLVISMFFSCNNKLQEAKEVMEEIKYINENCNGWDDCKKENIELIDSYFDFLESSYKGFIEGDDNCVNAINLLMNNNYRNRYKYSAHFFINDMVEDREWAKEHYYKRLTKFMKSYKKKHGDTPNLKFLKLKYVEIEK